MVLYVDLAFFLNCGMDALALYLTAVFTGGGGRWRRLLLSAAAGGVYGVVCMLPPFAAAGGAVGRCAAALGMVYGGFGGGAGYVRRLLLFLLLSCAMGGGTLAAAALVCQQGGLLHMEWRVFLLVAGGCYLLLSAAFPGGARHVAAGQLSRGRVVLDGRSVSVTMLLDTGHTLTDPVCGSPVLVVEAEVLVQLWPEDVRRLWRGLKGADAAESLEQLSRAVPGRFRLLPYRAVGVPNGLLLAFRADVVEVDGAVCRNAVVAVSPTPLSEHGEYRALWSGSGVKREEKRAA